MSVFRVNRNKNYTTMSNYHLKDKNISLKAKGLLSTMLSLPDNWGYSIEGLASINKENSKSIKNILDELKEFGYLIITKLLPNETKTGRIEYIYDIYEIPKTRVPKQEGCFQSVENKGVVSGDYKILKENIKEINTNNKKEKIKKEKYFENEKVNEIFLEFLDLRKHIKAKNTERAVKVLVNKLNKYDDDTKYKMIEKSIVNSWKDVYELKEKKETFNEMLERKMKEDD